MHYPCCSEKIKALVGDVAREALIRGRVYPKMFVWIHCAVWFYSAVGRTECLIAWKISIEFFKGRMSGFLHIVFINKLRKNF